MAVKIEMEGDGFSFDRKIPMGVAVKIVQLVEEEEFEVEEGESEEQDIEETDSSPASSGSVEGGGSSQESDADSKGMEGWR